MPTSDPANLSPIVTEISLRQPKKVLDLGIGVGKYGMLAREYLDIGAGRIKPHTWQTLIVGVEAFDPYRNDVWSWAYDVVHPCDFSNQICYSDYRDFDLVLLIDSLEHIEKSAGTDLLTHLLMHNRRVIVSCPTGVHYREQGAVNGNEYERHRAHWTEADFTLLGGKTLHKGVCIISSIKGQKQ